MGHNNVISDKTTNYLENKYVNRPDPMNIYPVGITDSEFRNLIIDELLPDWYVVDPLGHDQVNEEALIAILKTYKRDKQRR